MIKLNIFDADASRIAIQNLDPNIGVVLRKQVRDLFGPLNKAISIAVEIFFIAHVKRFCLVFKTIEVEMIDPATAAGVFVDDGKCWAGSLFGYTQSFT